MLAPSFQQCYNASRSLNIALSGKELRLNATLDKNKKKKKKKKSFALLKGSLMHLREKKSIDEYQPA